jgi:hypothetical protein
MEKHKRISDCMMPPFSSLVKRGKNGKEMKFGYYGGYRYFLHVG